MHTKYAYLKLRYLRWAVTANDQSLVYINVIQIGRLEHMPDCVSQQSTLVKDQILLRMIRYNIFTHFAKSWCLGLLECMAKRWVG